MSRRRWASSSAIARSIAGFSSSTESNRLYGSEKTVMSVLARTVAVAAPRLKKPTSPIISPASIDGDRLASYDDLGFACLDDVGHQIDVALLDKCSPG